MHLYNGQSFLQLTLGEAQAVTIKAESAGGDSSCTSYVSVRNSGAISHIGPFWPSPDTIPADKKLHAITVSTAAYDVCGFELP